MVKSIYVPDLDPACEPYANFLHMMSRKSLHAASHLTQNLFRSIFEVSCIVLSAIMIFPI